MQKTLPTATILLMLASANISAYAQKPVPIEMTAEKCFVEAPPEVFGLVPPNTRLDMVDYFKAGMDRPSENAAGGECALLSIDPESVTLQAGTGIKYQFFVLEGKQKPYIGVIETLATPGDDSMVRFYTSDWTPVEASRKRLFQEPTIADWMSGGDKSQLSQAKEAMPFILTSYSYDPATGTLTATNNMASYYHSSDTPEALSHLKPTITYKWDAKRDTFVMDKK